MRARSEYLKKGDKRTVSWFAWLPVVVRNSESSECRWLERVTVEQEAFGETMMGEEPCRCTYRWYNMKFVDEKGQP